ncbi:flavin reductase family protein [Massilia sp. G4R7]|uniref:Flavin reductase family protein n=1 Tax=Massilia phyllostachyos TaxID=2898585 RepID=A0ABS8QAE0_9BURK|nr:flavin reductase family protein [Massilia phyllostachyos]MCD2518017.1 flavin reductase family protein [Massilia phyllostachyos]
MARGYSKQEVPLHKIRRYLEPGPIVLVSSCWKGEQNIMTMGWHMVMEFSPSLIGCVIASSNHSFELIRKSRECVINLPTISLTDAVVGIGTHAGSKMDKFAHYGLTPEAIDGVQAPAIRECHAQFACRLHDDSLVDKYNFFIWEVVAARAAKTPKHPETLHYTGEGVFMVAGKVISRRSKGMLAKEPD